MPDLSFQITGVEAAARGLTPLLHFVLAVRNSPPEETIHAVLLQAQIQVEAAKRHYNEQEQARLYELFGPPAQWGQTLRSRLWAHAATNVRSFSGSAEAVLPVTCTYDLNVASTKYFYALDDGDVPLLFLFSGSIFYASAEGHLQVQPISWSKECTYPMPVAVWKAMMEHHYPNSAWLSLPRDLFDRLYAFRRQHGLPTWEHTLERLLPPLPKDAPAIERRAKTNGEVPR